MFKKGGGLFLKRKRHFWVQIMVYHGNTISPVYVRCFRWPPVRLVIDPTFSQIDNPCREDFNKGNFKYFFMISIFGYGVSKSKF